jgi:hypothetical protein
VSLRLRDVQIDVPAGQFDAAVELWSQLLGAHGSRRSSDGTFVHLLGPASPFGVHLQQLEDGPAGYHLDLETRDVDAEVARLVDLGARESGRPGGGATLRDPAGLPFCVRPWGEVDEKLQARRGDDPGLEFIVIDVATDAHAATDAFWAAALGAASHPVPPPNEAYRYLTSFEGPGGPGHILVQDTGPDGPTRLHLDLHVDTRRGRDAVVERAVALGATRHGAVHHWIVLATPQGHLFCVVPDHRDEDDT